MKSTPIGNPSPISADAMSLVGRYLNDPSILKASRVCKTWREGLKEHVEQIPMNIRENEYARRLEFDGVLIEALGSRKISLIRLPEFIVPASSSFAAIKRTDLSSPLMRSIHPHIDGKPSLLLCLRGRGEGTVQTADGFTIPLRDFSTALVCYAISNGDITANALQGEVELEEFLFRVHDSQNYKLHLKSLSFFERSRKAVLSDTELLSILENTHPVVAIDGPIKQTPLPSFALPPPRPYIKEMFALGVLVYLPVILTYHTFRALQKEVMLESVPSRRNNSQKDLPPWVMFIPLIPLIYITSLLIHEVNQKRRRYTL